MLGTPMGCFPDGDMGVCWFQGILMLPWVPQEHAEGASPHYPIPLQALTVLAWR